MNFLENQLHTLSLIPSMSFGPMEQESRASSLLFADPKPEFIEFPKPSPPEPEKRNFIQMWCNEATFFHGKFSSGATPQLSPKRPFKSLKPLEIPPGKRHLSEKAIKTKPISKKSGFFKLKKSDVVEISNNQEPEDQETELRTPSPKLKKASAYEFNSISLKKVKNSSFYDMQSDTTADYLDEEFGTAKNSFLKSDQERASSTHSRFTEDYEIIEMIGKGCFGTVYKCRNKLDGLIYAVKCSKNPINTSKSLSLNEAKALAVFSNSDDNPYVVRYFQSWIESHRLYLTMEYCNFSLRYLLETSNFFSEEQLRNILRDVTSGLRALHNRNVVHLDIKPENILSSQSGRFKIADLGLSRIAIRVKGEDIIEGDSRYLAPELLKEVSEENLPDLKKADIFSLGILLFELLTRQSLPTNGPFWQHLRSGNLSKAEVFSLIPHRRSMSLSNLIETIIYMLHPNPNYRPSAENVLLCEFLKEGKEEQWEKVENQILKGKIREYENSLGLKRKKSF